MSPITKYQNPPPVIHSISSAIIQVAGACIAPEKAQEAAALLSESQWQEIVRANSDVSSLTEEGDGPCNIASTVQVVPRLFALADQVGLNRDNAIKITATVFKNLDVPPDYGFGRLAEKLPYLALATVSDINVLCALMDNRGYFGITYRNLPNFAELGWAMDQVAEIVSKFKKLCPRPEEETVFHNFLTLMRQYHIHPADSYSFTKLALDFPLEDGVMDQISQLLMLGHASPEAVIDFINRIRSQRSLI